MSATDSESDHPASWRSSAQHKNDNVRPRSQDLTLEEIDPIDPEDVANRKILMRNWVLVVVAVGVMIAVVLLGITLMKDDTSPVVGGPSHDIDEILSYLLPSDSLKVARSNSSSPQAKALAWLRNDSQPNEYGHDRLRQRYALAVLFYSTNGEVWKDSTGWLSNASECTWHIDVEGAPSDQSCVEGSRFSALQFMGNGLVGSLPTELELLSDLRYLVLWEPRLSVAIPPEL
jgi:hypothetical protein